MSMYYIWHPYIVPEQPNSMELIITRGDAGDLGKVNKKFIETLLRDIGLKVNVTKWTSTRYRSNYFSEYLDEGNWEDIWQPVWRVRLSTTKKIASLPKMSQLWLGTNAMTTRRVVAKKTEDKAPCLVISDFKRPAALRQTQETIVADEQIKRMQRRYKVGPPAFTHVRVLGRYPQLQIDLGVFSNDFYARGADYAERVIKLCKKHKGAVHFAAHR